MESNRSSLLADLFLAHCEFLFMKSANQKSLWKLAEEKFGFAKLYINFKFTIFRLLIMIMLSILYRKFTRVISLPREMELRA